MTVRARTGAVLALGAVLAASLVMSWAALDRAPNYDEGNYAAALDALRHGQELGSEVYLVQPPGFYLMLEGIAGVLGDGLRALRVGMLLVSLIALAAAFAIGRAYAGTAGGIGAAGLLAVAPPFPQLAPLIESDPP